MPLVRGEHKYPNSEITMQHVRGERRIVWRRYEAKRSENGDGVYIIPAAGPVDYLVDWCVQSRGWLTARSTGVHKRAKDSAQNSSVDRSVDRSRRTIDRLT